MRTPCGFARVLHSDRCACIDQPVKDKWAIDALKRPLGIYYRVDKTSVVDLQAAIADAGAVYVSAMVHPGWDIGNAQRVPKKHADLPVIPYAPNASGVHAIALVGYNEIGFVVQNSWGTNWGASGFAIMTYADWVANGTDAWVVALGAPVAQSVQPVVARRAGGKFEPPHSARHFVVSRATVSGRAGSPGWLGGDDPLRNRSGPQWSAERAYRHAIVTGNDGCMINRLPDAGDAAHAAKSVAFDEPMKWLAKRPP